MPSPRVSRFFNQVDQAEFALCRSINHGLRYRPALSLFKVVSRLGDGWLWYALILSLPLIYPGQGLAIALLMTGSGLACTITYKLLKRWLVRERPFISFPVIHCGTPPLDRYSFPSGHTLHAVCFTMVLALTLPALAILILPFTLAVAASRVVLGLHYPSDVLAGAVIGGVIGTVATAWGLEALLGSV
ncbi:phosphatase PAP2 family protein [Marinobacter zhanjiangensis]|uniref:undecaprenyl-diphosphate phosphatase n=1 Tax=Marinobacter zhanjiangensis TaxID=578215 RepID=A0ABQ3AVE8_9GAMM|nr:phosphatase PAP2 family protein [Marinobacter zhanjiangensis]GGY69035.1 phosphatase PAP2 family protein [Marinobacter zhanjiangensis]